jgi:hypothetical protein
MALIQHLFGIPSLRRTRQEIEVNIAYRWFLGYGLLENIPHFATIIDTFYEDYDEPSLTVIGNIHDTPKLLEG